MPMPSSSATGARSGQGTGSAPRVSWGKSQHGWRPGQQQQFTDEQMQLFQQMFGHLGPDSFLGKLASGDENTFNEVQAPAWRDFQSGMGQLGSRFAGMGSGALKSSGFKNTASSASSQFAQDLQSQRQSLQQQALRDLMGFSNDLMGQRPYENFLMQKEPSFWEKILGSIGGNITKAGSAAASAYGMGGF